jgi:4,5-dihydroxyphthalate decarboxylase
VPKPVLQTVTRTQGNNRALKDGTVAPAGFDLEFTEIPVLVHGFRRMVRQLEFDVCEMAITTYLCARAHGVAFTALPVFLVRGFHHGAITAATPMDPAAVAGKRVGVNRGYTVTTGVWARGILADEHGVDTDGVEWVCSGDEHVAEYVPPANVSTASAPLPDLLAAGELAAGISVDYPQGVPLIADAEEAGYRALTERGHYPINHLVVVKDSVLAEHPELPVALFEAFAESKNRYVAGLSEIAEPTAIDRMHQRVAKLTGGDPLPYGIEPNRPVIDELIRHAVSQHILAEAPRIEDLFAKSTLDLTA